MSRRKAKRVMNVEGLARQNCCLSLHFHDSKFPKFGNVVEFLLDGAADDCPASFFYQMALPAIQQMTNTAEH